MIARMVAALDPATTDGDYGVVEANERIDTPANYVTAVRTVVSLILCLAAITTDHRLLLILGLAVYWIGDSLDGIVARLRHCESRLGATLDLVCDRLNCAGFYIALVSLEHHLLVPVSVYLVEFMTVDSLLSLAFLSYPIRSPNYFFVVDLRIWRWNWSRPGKTINSGLFAILLLITHSAVLGTVVATALLAIKVASTRWLLRLDPDLATPGRAVGAGTVDR